ncbi:hypothetical protein Tco_0317483 [Tanacetum coccineum]
MKLQLQRENGFLVGLKVITTRSCVRFLQKGKIPSDTSAADGATTCASGTQSADVALPCRLTWDPHGDTWPSNDWNVRIVGLRFRYEVWKAARGNHWLYEVGIPSQSLARVKRALEVDMAQADWWIWNVTVCHYLVLRMEIRDNNWRNH